MEILLYFLKATAVALLTGEVIAMFVRAISSFFPLGDMIESFAYSVSEPIIVPARVFLDKFEFVKNSPFDIPFFVTFLLLSFVQSLIS